MKSNSPENTRIHSGKSIPSSNKMNSSNPTPTKCVSNISRPSTLKIYKLKNCKGERKMRPLAAASSIKNQKLTINLKFSLKNLSFKIRGLKRSPKPKINRFNSFRISQNSWSIRSKKWVHNFVSTAISTTPSLSTRADSPSLDRKSIDSTLS